MQVSRFTLALGLTLLAANSASAQNGSHSTTSSEKAARLIAQADGIQDLRSWSRKAKLYEQAANLLPSDSEELSITLIRAASSFYYAGDKPRAATVFQRAAAAAQKQGNTGATLDAHYFNLVLAAERNQLDEVRRVIDQMVLLAASDECNEEQRIMTLRRIAGPIAFLARITAN